MEIIEIDGKKDLIFCLVKDQGLLVNMVQIGFKSMNFMEEDQVKMMIIIRNKKEAGGEGS